MIILFYMIFGTQLSSFKYCYLALIMLFFFNYNHLFTHSEVVLIIVHIQSFISTQLKDFKYCYLTLIILFNINQFGALVVWFQILLWICLSQEQYKDYSYDKHTGAKFYMTRRLVGSDLSDGPSWPRKDQSWVLLITWPFLSERYTQPRASLPCCGVVLNVCRCSKDMFNRHSWQGVVVILRRFFSIYIYIYIGLDLWHIVRGARTKYRVVPI